MATRLCFVVLSLLAPHPFSQARTSPPPQVIPWDATTISGAEVLVTTLSPPLASLEDLGKEVVMRDRKHNVSESEEKPPSIFYPPTQPDVPTLVASGADFLKFEFRLKCSGRCPSSYTWRYRKKVDDGKELSWKENKNTTSIGLGNQVGSVVTISGLESNTSYEVKAQPILVDENNTPRNWYQHLPTNPFTPSASGMTCDVEQEGVRELKVHSAGSKWLALSWLHPMPICNTLLQYHIRHKGDLQRVWSNWRNAGSFWTNASWSVQGDVKPCYLWPDRHCLLLMNGDISSRKVYTVEIQVERQGDREKSKIESVQGETKSFRSSSPEKLRCVESRSTSLSLSWSSPLEPGGVLTKALIHIYDADNNLVKEKDKQIDMQPYYEKKISGLKPATLYNVTVMFVSADGIVGTPAKLVTWTSPEEGKFGGSCYDGSPANSSISGSAAAASGAPEATNGSGPWWIWPLVGLTILSVAVGFFILGRRCPNEVSWKVVRLSKGSSSSSSEGSTGLSKRDLEHGSSDLEALCTGAGASMKGTPPSSIADYAESSGYAVVSSPTAVAPRSFSSRNQYAEPNHVLEEQPYAEALDARGPQPPPLYTEVRRSSATPSPVNIPLYAEVDKKRRLPPPPPLKVPPPPKLPPLPPSKIPPPVPAKPIHLQDSD